MIKVLIVDDSAVSQKFLSYLFSREPDINVVGIANNGFEAIDLAKRYKPDVISMDIHMPGMSGFETTRRIMETNPIPIVIVSGNNNVKDVEIAFQAMEAGALATVAKPEGFLQPEFELKVRELVQTIRIMSEIKTIKRWPEKIKPKEKNNLQTIDTSAKTIPKSAKISIIAIGASTGGPSAIQEILSGLKKDLTVPILITQHMSAGFEQGFVDWLKNITGIPVKIGENGENALRGHVYVAGTESNMGITQNGNIFLSPRDPFQPICPAVSFLFTSVAGVYSNLSMGIILTGMGSDGSKELKLMRDKGAVTIAQNEESCVVFGMPKEAITFGGATHIMNPKEIAFFINSTIN
jgi:two-component system chemotaxis response regulator CheB